MHVLPLTNRFSIAYQTTPGAMTIQTSGLLEASSEQYRIKPELYVEYLGSVCADTLEGHGFSTVSVCKIRVILCPDFGVDGLGCAKPFAHAIDDDSIPRVKESKDLMLTVHVIPSCRHLLKEQPCPRSVYPLRALLLTNRFSVAYQTAPGAMSMRTSGSLEVSRGPMKAKTTRIGTR